jgi:tryptophan synthase alpha chain
LAEPATAHGGQRTAGALAEAFASSHKRAALMPYLMGGFPDLDSSRDAGLAAADNGADVLELGVPFSDPLADGPVIHAAATEALKQGTKLDDVLRVAAVLAPRLPVVLMVYANPILARGVERFTRLAADAGVAGMIVPDLPYDEAGELRAAADAAGLALVPLAAPTSTDERLADVGRDGRGFIYTVSLTGTTGERSSLPPELSQTVERMRSHTQLPVAVGFGISTAEQAAAVGDLADGVIVGSRVVRAAGEGGASAVGAVVAELAEALAPD